MSFNIPLGGMYSSADLDAGSTVITDQQTVFAWVKTADTVRLDIFSFAGTQFARWHGVEIFSGVRGRTVSSSSNVTGTVPLPSDTWTPMCVRIDSFDAGGEYVKLDLPGVQGVRTLSIGVPSYGDGYQVFFGSSPEESASPLFTGKLAHLTHWNAVLSDSDVASLMSSADPATIQRGSQISYWDGDSVTDEIAGYTVSASGGADLDTGDNPPISSDGFTITSVGGDDQYYPGETNVALALSEAVTLASCTLDDGVTTPVNQPLTGGEGTANQTFNSVQGDNPYTKDHNGAQLGSRPRLTFTASD